MRTSSKDISSGLYNKYLDASKTSCPKEDRPGLLIESRRAGSVPLQICEQLFEEGNELLIRCILGHGEFGGTEKGIYEMTSNWCTQSKENWNKFNFLK